MWSLSKADDFFFLTRFPFIPPPQVKLYLWFFSLFYNQLFIKTTCHRTASSWRVGSLKDQKKFNKVEQIVRTRDEPQQIVATRLLYCLQYPALIQVVCKGFTPAHIFNTICNFMHQVFPLSTQSIAYNGSQAYALFRHNGKCAGQHHCI